MRASRRDAGSALLVAGLWALLAACQAADAPADAPADTASGDTVVVADDPELADRVRVLLPELAERAGLEWMAPVRIERRDRDALRRYLETKIEEELPADEARAMTDVYGMLGLLPDTTDLRALLLSIYTEQVAGFYDPDSTALFLVEQGDSADLAPVLVHELVHALQDQHVDLDSLTARGLENDRRTAAQAVIEGHATLVMFERLLSEAMGEEVDLSALPPIREQLGPAVREMNAQFPALSGAPRIIRESLLFPYLGGAAYVQAVWAGREGRPSPVSEYLPASTEQVLHPGRRLEEPVDGPTGLDVRVTAGGRRVYTNSLGELELTILLDEHLGAPAGEAAVGWDGDRYVLVERPDGGRSLVWYAVLDDAPSRDRLAGALGRLVEGLTVRGEVARVELDGRPGVRLGLGEGVETEARLVR